MNIIKKIKKKGLKTSLLFAVVSTIYLVSKKIFTPFFMKNKVDDKMILFSSNPDFSDNSKILYEYYKSLEKYKDYKFVWLISRNDNIKNYKEKNTIFVKSTSFYHKGICLKALYYTSIAKLIYFTHSSPFESINKKDNQLVINLWHGCGYKDTQKRDKTFIEKYPFDYALVPGKVFIDTKSSFWGCKKEMVLPIGYPRYDLFYKKNNKTSNYVDDVSGNNKLIVWMPTFRKTGSNYYPEEKVKTNYDIPLLNSEEELINLNSVCLKNNVKLCIKRHPMQLKYKSEGLKLSNIVFIDNSDLVKNNIDLYSLLKYTDALITDYSSVGIDYVLLDKPIAFTLDDFEKYSESRGFVFEDPKKYMPGHHIYCYEDILNFIISVSKGEDIYKEDRNKIMDDIHNKCDNYCERVVNSINSL